MSVHIRANLLKWLSVNCMTYSIHSNLLGIHALELLRSRYAVFVEDSNGWKYCVGVYTRKRDAIRHYFSRQYRTDHQEAWIDDLVNCNCLCSILHNGYAE